MSNRVIKALDKKRASRWTVTPNGATVCEGLGVVMSVREDGTWYAYPSRAGAGRLGPFGTVEEAQAALEAADQDDET